MEAYYPLLTVAPKDGEPAKHGFELAMDIFNERLASVLKNKKPREVVEISFGASYAIDAYIREDKFYYDKYYERVRMIREKKEKVRMFFEDVSIGQIFTLRYKRIEDLIFVKISPTHARVLRATKHIKWRPGMEPSFRPMNVVIAFVSRFVL